MPADAEPDHRLLHRWRRDRDAAAFAVIVGRHAHAVQEAAVAQLRRHGLACDADDAAQAAWVVLARRARSGSISARLHGSLAPWLRRTAALCAKAQVRGERRRRHREATVARPEVAAPPASDELAEVVATALRSLPRRERRILTLRHLDGRPWPEVATLCQTTPDAARKVATRAHDRLRRRLEQLGVTAAPPAVAAALARLAEAGRFAPVAPVLPAVLARKVLIMSSIKSTAVCSLATVGLLGGSAAYIANAQSEGAGPTPTFAAGSHAAMSASASQASAPAAEPGLKEDLTTLEQLVQERNDGWRRAAELETELQFAKRALANSQLQLLEASSAGAATTIEDDAIVDGALPGGLGVDGFRTIHGTPPSLAKTVNPYALDKVGLAHAALILEDLLKVPIHVHPSALRDGTNTISFADAGPLRGDHLLERVVFEFRGPPAETIGVRDVIVAWRFGTYMILDQNALNDLDAYIESTAAEKLLHAQLTPLADDE